MSRAAAAAPSLAPFSLECRACPRLADHLAGVRETHPAYHAKPVAPFGDAAPRLLIVGLAPGMHGANRTGRPFTGDYAGILLYETLHRYGYGSRPDAIASDDGLTLSRCRITNAVKCLPPQNKPQPDEVRRCNGHLQAELAGLPQSTVILALGSIAHQAILMAYGVRRAAYVFAHRAKHMLPSGHTLFDSYHCSRYNTQTRRLTPDMFHQVFDDIAAHLS
ncbi:MAG TPA: uracil-DNA glycosylase [Burkholderiales bacterium]|nr:uracil-DNA glycosylase [Burkholderiales bacterium]